MKTFIYKVITSSSARGFNHTIEVYRVKNNQPEYIGYNDRINTASYRGDRATACHIISEKTGAKMKDGYNLLSDSIQLFEV